MDESSLVTAETNADAQTPPRVPQEDPNQEKKQIFLFGIIGLICLVFLGVASFFILGSEGGKQEMAPVEEQKFTGVSGANDSQEADTGGIVIVATERGLYPSCTCENLQYPSASLKFTYVFFVRPGFIVIKDNTGNVLASMPYRGSQTVEIPLSRSSIDGELLEVSLVDDTDKNGRYDATDKIFGDKDGYPLISSIAISKDARIF